MRWPNFISPSYHSQSPIALGVRCVNLYVDQITIPGGKNSQVLYPTPGIETLFSLSDTPVRGLFAENGRVWAVSGGTLYELFVVGTNTSRGTVARDQYPATICSNGAGQLFITSGGLGYILDTTTNVLTNIAGLVANMGFAIGPYFGALDFATPQIRISDALDGLTWDPTQFARNSLSSDPWQSTLVVNGRLYLFGTATSQVWWNAGDFPFPLAPVTTNLIQFGIAARFARENLQDTATWLAQSPAGAGIVLQTRGIAVDQLQNEALSFELSQYSTIADAQVWGYEDQNHPFLLFDFPSASATWGVDGLNGFWHERGFWDSVNAVYQANRPSCHCYEWGIHLVGDRSSGTVYRMGIDLGLDADGASLRRLYRPPSLAQENQLLSLDSLELMMEPGLGLVTGQGSDPTILMRLSKNGGKTFGSARTRHVGKIGKFSERIIWERCGTGRDLQPEFYCTDAIINWRIIDCYVEVTVEAA